MRIKDVSTDMAGICERNREREAMVRQWKAAHTRDGFTEYSLGDVMQMPPRPKYVAIDEDGWIAIDYGYDGCDYYDFDGAEEIKTPLDLLEWISHLCGKVWMDAERVRQLIVAVCDARGWPARIERY